MSAGKIHCYFCKIRLLSEKTRISWSKRLSDILHKVASGHFTCIESFQERGKRRAAITVFFEIMVNNKSFSM